MTPPNRSGESLLRHARRAAAAIPYADREERQAAPPTLAQQRELRRLGHEGPTPATLGEAVALIAQLRAQQGRAGHSGAVLGIWLMGALFALFALALARPAAAQGFSSIILVGDSITRGYGTSGTGQSAPVLLSLAAGLGIDPAGISNRGVNGLTTSDWLNGRIEAAVAAAPAHSLFLIMLGTNDAKIGPSGRSPGEWLFHARLIVSRIQGAGHEAIWNASPYIGAGAAGWPANSGDRVALYNAQIQQTGAIVGDTGAWDWFRDRPERLPDSVHPDDAGAVALGQMWAAAARDHYGIVLPESGAGMFLVALLMFLAGASLGRRGWRWWR